MAQRKQLRILFLAVTLGGILLVLVRVFLAKPLDKQKPEEIRGQAHTTSHLVSYLR
ncbi:hypothetical protein NIES4074_37380 [Cylindrospermum sp. NIES-4074]|nr:hypothetical protein NIES4074_37380 [Cylindrospermum sp. NIES-4074]